MELAMLASPLRIAPLLVLTGSLCAQPLKHPEPTLHSVFPDGGRQGTTVEVEFAGADGLIGANNVYIEGQPGVAVRNVRTERASKASVVRATFVIAADAPAGRRLIRVQGGSCGLSNARPFFVSRLPEVVEKEPNN